MDKAVRGWGRQIAGQTPQLIRLGYFGSYARGDWGVGSDLDLVAVVTSADLPFERRSTRWDLSSLPVPAELLIYTQEEWEQLQNQGSRFAHTLAQETIWVYPS